MKKKNKKKVKRKKKLKKIKLKKVSFKRKSRKYRKSLSKKSKKKYKIKKKQKKTSFKKKSRKISKRSFSINLAVRLIRAGESVKSLFRFNFNLDKKIQKILQVVSKKISSLKLAIENEKERLKRIKIKEMEQEKIDAENKIKVEQEMALKSKIQEYKDEIKFEKDRKKELKQFLRQEQAELRKEHAERQRKFLEQIKLEKKIEKFRQREANEIKFLTKYVLSQQRENYKDVEERIVAIKKRYQELRDQKIRERVEQLGITVTDGDDRTVLLEKEKNYYLERQKVEYALESFWRSAHSLCFALNRKYVPKYLSIFRCLDFRLERGEVLIKFDDAPEEDWLILIYLDSKSEDGNIIIEDKTNPESSFSKEFKSSEIFQANDMMVDSLTQLLSREREKRKAS